MADFRLEPISKIPSILNARQGNIFGTEVIITEKIDGSQFSFGVMDGVLQYKSKRKMLNFEQPDKTFTVAIQQVEKFAHLIIPDTQYCTEYLKTPRHGVLNYNTVPKHHMYLFAARDGLQDVFHGDQVVKMFADDIGIDHSQVLFRGILENFEQLDALLDTQSYLGGPNVEGLVIESLDKTLRQPIAKYVSPEFREKAGHRVGNTHLQGLDLNDIIIRYNPEIRFHKVLQVLRDESRLKGELSDIGLIIKEVQSDFAEEEKRAILKALTAHYNQIVVKNYGFISKQQTKQIPEWYKAILKEEHEKSIDGDV